MEWSALVPQPSSPLFACCTGTRADHGMEMCPGAHYRRPVAIRQRENEQEAEPQETRERKELLLPQDTFPFHGPPCAWAALQQKGRGLRRMGDHSIPTCPYATLDTPTRCLAPLHGRRHPSVGSGLVAICWIQWIPLSLHRRPYENSKFHHLL